MSDTNSEQGEGNGRCAHIVEALEGPEKVALSGKFKTAAAWYFQRTHDSIHPSKRRKVLNHAFGPTNQGINTTEKVASPNCGTCSMTLARPFVCLHCAYSGCWTKSHIHSHLRHTGHFFCKFRFGHTPDLSHCLKRLSQAPIRRLGGYSVRNVTISS